MNEQNSTTFYTKILWSIKQIKNFSQSLTRVNSNFRLKDHLITQTEAASLDLNDNKHEWAQMKFNDAPSVYNGPDGAIINYQVAIFSHILYWRISQYRLPSLLHSFPSPITFSILTPIFY